MWKNIIEVKNFDGVKIFLNL